MKVRVAVALFAGAVFGAACGGASGVSFKCQVICTYSDGSSLGGGTLNINANDSDVAASLCVGNAEEIMQTNLSEFNALCPPSHGLHATGVSFCSCQ